MFNWYLLTLLGQKEECLNLKKEVAQTPLKKTIDDIIEKVNRDISKIIELNQI